MIKKMIKTLRKTDAGFLFIFYCYFINRAMANSGPFTGFIGIYNLTKLLAL